MLATKLPYTIHGTGLRYLVSLRYPVLSFRLSILVEPAVFYCTVGLHVGVKKYIDQEPPYLMRQICVLQWEEIKTKRPGATHNF